jgi:hypothetical protein
MGTGPISQTLSEGLGMESVTVWDSISRPRRCSGSPR